MRKTVLAFVALAGLAASPAWASFSGSIYYTNFIDHHVRRLDVAGNVAGGTTDLVTLPGADGIIFDPLDNNKLLVGGQLQNNVYRIGTNPGGYSVVNTGPVSYGAFHLAVQSPNFIGTAPGGTPVGPTLLASGMEGPSPNGLGLIHLNDGSVDNRLIAGTLAGRVSGIAVRDVFGLPVQPQIVLNQTIYITDGQEDGAGGRLYTVNLGSNTASLVNVLPNGATQSKDLHGLWLDKKTGHLFATGTKHLEEIDLDALGGPKLFRSWDLGFLIPENEASQGHTDQVASDDFGNLFVAANSGQIIYLDLNAGVPLPTLLKKVGDVHLDDLVVGPAAIPEPSTLVLAGLGLVGAAMLRKRA